METTAEQLIRDKSFDALSQEELLVVQELCDSEEEFQSMKQFFREMEQLTLAQKTVVSPSIKESLDNIFAAKHPGIRANWSAPAAAELPHAAKVVPLYQRKWVRIAAVFVLAAGTIPFWLLFSEKEAMKTVPSVQMAKEEKVVQNKTEGSSVALPEKSKVLSENSSKEVPVMTYRTIAQPHFSDKVGEYKVATAGSASLAEDVAADAEGNVEAFMGSVSSPLIAAPPATYSFSNGTATYGFTANSSAPKQDGLLFSKPSSNLGMMADLNPEGRTRFQLKYIPQSPLAASLDQQPDELLDMLVPAF